MEGWHTVSSAQPCYVLNLAYQCSLLKTPSFLSSSSSFEFLFQDASGSSVKCAVHGTASCISCLSICASQINRERSKNTKPLVIPVSNGLENIKAGLFTLKISSSLVQDYESLKRFWASVSLIYKKATPPLKISPLWAALLYFHII